MAGVSDKKRIRKDDEMECKEDDDVHENLEEESEGDDEEMEEDAEEMVDEMMQLDFEGRKPENLHYNGICTLLHQVFLKLNVNISEMTDWIIKHNNVGAVLQQLEPSDDEGDDDSGDDSGIVMSVTSVVDITNEQESEFAKQLKAVLLERCKSCAAKHYQQFENIIKNTDQRVGFLVNEKMIGLPPHVAVFESLWKDIEKTKKSEQEYNFSYYLLMSKTLRPVMKKSEKKKQGTATIERHFMNNEEELFFQNSVLSFDFSVKDQCDAALSGIWDDDEGECYEPFRTVSIVAADKIPTIMSQMASWIASNN